MFKMFHSYEGLTRSGRGSASDLYEFKEYRDGELHFVGESGPLRVDPHSFIYSIGMQWPDPYSLTSGTDKEEVVKIINRLILEDRIKAVFRVHKQSSIEGLAQVLVHDQSEVKEAVNGLVESGYLTTTITDWQGGRVVVYKRAAVKQPMLL